MEKKKEKKPVASRLKNLAPIITAIGGIILGLLAFFKDVKDPKAEASHNDTATVVKQLSDDLRTMAQEIDRNRHIIYRMKATLAGYMIAGSKSLSLKQTELLLKQFTGQHKFNNWKLPPERRLKRWRELRQKR